MFDQLATKLIPIGWEPERQPGRGTAITEEN